MKANRLLALALLLAPALSLATVTTEKWKTVPSTYRVFAHVSVNGVPNFSQAVPAVQAGFARWTASQVSCTTWNATYGGTFTSPERLAALNANDRINNVIWLGGADWKLDNNTLGLTTITFFTQSGEIFDADMQLNNNRPWKLGGAGLAIDVESLIAHEAGHYLGLDHTPNSATVMFATYPVGEIKRELQPPDVSDVCLMYPKPNTPQPLPDAGTPGGTKTQGMFCTANSECAASAPVCRGGATTGNSKICTTDCTNNPTCPNGYTCQTDSAGTKSCLIPPAAGDLCKFCSSGSQCASGLCVGDGRHNWCARTCTDANSAATSCGPNYQCSALDGTNTFVCQPVNTTCPTAQCTSAAQCPVGYGCVSGMCEAAGKPGDRCEVSKFCDGCADCIGTTAEAYCRSCCGGINLGGRCDACPNAACANGFSCVPETNMKDAVCVPTQGAATCAACGDQVACQPGLTCQNGRCLAPCNPAQPGSCGACVQSAGGGGLCACPDTVAQKGQSCGMSANGTVVSCANGSVCVDNPKTCRARCTNSSQCDTGETCATVDGETVCVLSKSPGTKCNACDANNACASGLTCYNGRCYPPCDAEMPACGSCVDIVGSTDVCACDDQRSGPGEACGPVGGDVYACATGSSCINGTCYLECPEGGNCPPNLECRAVNSRFVCATPSGAPVVDGGVVLPTPDGGQTPSLNSGCGCGSAGGSSLYAALALVAVALRAGWRRRSAGN